MANQFQLAGAQETKPVHFAPIFTNRFFQGLWTQRNPLRDAGSTRIEEKFYGTRGDAMIAGSNVEISNRLTPVRRPGNSMYNSQSFTSVDSFYSFRLFNTTSETIKVMVDTATALYDGTGPSTQSLVFTKSAAANGAQTFMQSVGNTLYFSDGVDQPKKWVQSLTTWQASTPYNPFNLGTYLIDTNGNIEQLISTIIPISTIAVNGSNVVTVVTSSSTSLSGVPVLTPGLQVRFPATLTATFLENIVLTINTVSAHSFTASSSTFTHASYGPTADSGTIVVVEGGSAVTGTAQPTWPATLLQTTDDNLARWINRGNPVQNWGIAAPTTAPTFTVNGTTNSWSSHTYYSSPGVVIDHNNVWQLTVKGTSGTTNPFPTNPSQGQTQTDGTITWMCVTPHTTNTWAASASYLEGTYQGSYPWNTNPGDGQFLPDFTSGKFILANAGGKNCLFMLQRTDPASGANVPVSVSFGGAQAGQPGWTCKFFNSTTTDGTIDLDFGGSVGNPVLYGTATPAVVQQSTDGVNSIFWNFYGDGNAHGYNNFPMHNNTVSENGVIQNNVFTTPWPGQPHTNFEWIQYGKIRIVQPGISVTFFIARDESYYFGIDPNAGATPVSFSTNTGNANGTGLGTRTQTPWNGYSIMAGNNATSHFGQDTITVNFANAGVFGIEWVFGQGTSGHFDFVIANSFIMTPEQATAPPFFQSGTATPPFGAASWNPAAFAPLNTYPSAIDSTFSQPNFVDWNVSYNANLLTWFNFGPVTDFAWSANTPYTLPSTVVLDTNSNNERAYETGITGTTAPTWATGLYQLTADASPLQWINEGPAPPVVNTAGTITATSAQGFIYYVALVNTLTGAVSNASPASISTGKFTGTVTLNPNSGLPPAASIDPQVDYVAIFRTTDGGSTPFLIPGTTNENTVFTVDLKTYQTSGYTDNTPDSGLNILLEAPLEGQDTPPATGLVNLTYHLGRIFGSIGNTVFWSVGPDATIGTGNEGFPPLNNAVFPSLVKRIVPTSIGALVFTVSDIYLISGQGTASSPLFSQPYANGIGLRSYNALAVNGTTVFFFTSDSQVVSLDPSSGLSQVGFPIGDQLTLSNWNPANVYVTWHVAGSQDHALFVSDGQTGWFRMTPTAAPESGLTWSPFATITGGVKAVQSIEVSPGVHDLLLGPTGTGNILKRDLTTWQDNGTSFTANFTIGSIVLAQPGQIAELAFITTDAIATGTRPSVGVLIDEISGTPQELPRYTQDPPQLASPASVYSQRFYFSQSQAPAICRHMQIQIAWPAENAQNELLSLTIFGAYMQED